MERKIKIDEVRNVLSLLGITLDDWKVSDNYYFIGEESTDSSIITSLLNIHGYYGQTIKIHFEGEFLKQIEIFSTP